MCKDSMNSHNGFMNGPETGYIAHGGELSPNTFDASTNTLRFFKKSETSQQVSCETVQNEFEMIQQSGQR